MPMRRAAVANSALVKTSWHGGDPTGAESSLLSAIAGDRCEQRWTLATARRSHKILWSLKRGQPTAATFKAYASRLPQRN